MMITKHSLPKLSLYFAFALLVVACGPSTRITATWKKPEATPKSNMLVVALTHSIVAKATVESALAFELQKDDVEVTKSSSLFAPNFQDDIGKNKEMLLKKIRENGHDGILTVTLLDQVSETRYVPGQASYAPAMSYGYYGGFYNYYNYRYPTVYQPGYYTEDKTYYLESNLYDVETEELLWSAQSQTYNPSDLQKFSSTFAKMTVARLQSEGLIN